jgi:hypothetical protein
MHIHLLDRTMSACNSLAPPSEDFACSAADGCYLISISNKSIDTTEGLVFFTIDVVVKTRANCKGLVDVNIGRGIGEATGLMT